MIIIGKKKPKFIPVEHMVSLEIVRGKTRVYVTGEALNGYDAKIDNIDIVEPYAVVIKDTTGYLHYINCKSFEEAQKHITNLYAKIVATRANTNQVSPQIRSKIKKEIEDVYK